MVYVIHYNPLPYVLIDAEIVEGVDDLRLEDTTSDGGRGINLNQSTSGRRVVPSSVPRVIRRQAGDRIQDFEGVFVYTVSDRLRRLIEELEPGIHQFEPLRYIGNHDETLEERWFWQVCHRLDSVHRKLSNVELAGSRWRPRSGREWDIAFDSQQIAGKSFWCDKHLQIGIIIADEVRERFVAERVTGLEYTYFPQA